MHSSFEEKGKKIEHIEGSIYEDYIIEEISNFCSFYFELHIQTKLNRVPRNDDGGDVDRKECLSVFIYPGRPLGEPREHRILTKNEYDAIDKPLALFTSAQVVKVIKCTQQIGSRIHKEHGY